MIRFFILHRPNFYNIWVRYKNSSFFSSSYKFKIWKIVWFFIFMGKKSS